MKKIAAVLGAGMLMVAGCSGGDSGGSGDQDYISSFLTSPLIVDENGDPNPRVSCTDGNTYARDYLVDEMGKLGLIPAGSNTDPTSFLNMVPGSVDATYCPDGMANVIGLIKGTVSPDEYILWVAHYDGPNNEGVCPQDGNGNTVDAYDNGSSVPIGLQLAAHFISEPPDRSVVIVFSAGEEGWRNVLPRKDGIPVIDCTADKFPAFAKAGCAYADAEDPPRNGQYPIGFTAWVQNPTVPLEKVKLVIGADPLGAQSVRGSDLLVLVGANDTPGLESILEDVWPQKNGLQTNVYIKSSYVASNYVDTDAVSKWYASYNCGGDGQAKCVEAGGVPYITLSQPGFQKYHGGFEYGALSKVNFWEWSGLTVNTAYWSLDTVAVFDLEALRNVYDSIRPALVYLSSTPRLDSISYGGTYDDVTAQDVRNNMAAMDYLSSALGKGSEVTSIPEATTYQAIDKAYFLWHENYKLLKTIEPGKTKPDIEDNLKLLPLIMSVDFFSTENLDQLTPFSNPCLIP